MSGEYLGADIPKLGFGLMRLPMIGDKVDIEQTKKMADMFIENGFTYFDTAYNYINGQSEEAANTAVVSRYPRESFQLATKLPIWEVETEGDMEKIVQTQLKRTCAGYFDFYLLHALDRDKINKLDKFKAWDFVRGLKERGIAKHIGFSYHDTADRLDSLLYLHPEVEFVQLQINYADWNDPGIQSGKCHEVARKHGKPVIVMEPVKGGALAQLPEEGEQVLKKHNPEMSAASWAIRFAASQDGIITVLSGMSNLEQMADNVSYMKDFKPLTEDEKETLAQAAAVLADTPSIPCTSCKYCMDVCPQNIAIPQIFMAYNFYKLANDLQAGRRKYELATGNTGVKGSECIQCASCQGVCPQHIAIIDTMAAIVRELE